MRACIASLERFYVPEAALFARSMTWDGATWTKTAPSPNHTANVLLALYALQRRGMTTAVDPAPVMERLVRWYADALDYTGLSFLLWADALGDGSHGAILWPALRAALPSGTSNSMHLSWVLSALCHHVAVAPVAGPVERLAGELYRRLAANQSVKSGLLYDSGVRDGWLRRRKPLGTLSSQAYSIYALALYGRVFGVPDALARAARCAAAICTQQGPQGQWWWRYDVESGIVIEKYPVYAVNQDSAMPMALLELARSTGCGSYAARIVKGVNWLFGSNELGRPLADESVGVIWRGIQEIDDRFELLPTMHAYHAARCLYTWCAVPPRNDASAVAARTAAVGPRNAAVWA